mgnify:FL=1
MISNSDELDIYWTNGVPKANNCLIVTKPEFGSAPWVAVSGVIGKREPVGRVISKFHYQDVYNALPDFDEPGWPIYHVENDGEDWLVMVIEYWRPISLDPAQSTSSWIYSYPIVRGICDIFKEQVGVKHLCYATTTSSNNIFPDEIYPQVKRSRAYEYNYSSGRKTNRKVFLLPPSWLFPYFFSLMGGQGKTVFTGYKEGQSVDSLAADTLSKYFRDNLCLPVNNEHMELAAERVVEEESDEKETLERMEVMKDNVSTKSDNSMLWG